MSGQKQHYKRKYHAIANSDMIFVKEAILDIHSINA
jgi:hypothetical protein